MVHPSLSITVLHYNNDALTTECCDSVDQQEIPVEHEKVVVDNGSTTPFPPRDGWRVVRLEKNRGNIGGQNACFEHAEGKWILFVANDVRIHKHCIRRLWNTSQENGALGQLQPLLLGVQESIDHSGMHWRWPGYGRRIQKHKNCWTDMDGMQFCEATEKIAIVPSTCYLLRKDILKDYGGFDEQLRSSHEDVDMGLRLRLLGFVNMVRYDATATHLGNATLKHTIRNPSANFHHDRRYVIRKHYWGLDRWLRLCAESILYHTHQLLTGAYLPTPHTISNPTADRCTRSHLR